MAQRKLLRNTRASPQGPGQNVQGSEIPRIAVIGHNNSGATVEKNLSTIVTGISESILAKPTPKRYPTASRLKPA
jgi:hypothetical protein